MIGTDFLQARLYQDWEEFERQGRKIVAQKIAKYDRASFRDKFQRLEKAGCHADVLFPCIYIYSSIPEGRAVKS